MSDIIQVTEGITESEARTRALQSDAVRRFLGEKEPARVIYIPRQLINFVIRN
jgi:hypothetical protein